MKIKEKFKLSRQTRNLLDCLAALGNFIEVIDERGFYIYISPNCTYDLTTADELIGLHVTEAFELTKDSSILLNTLSSGKPYRDLLLKYKSTKAERAIEFLYNSFPIIENNSPVGAITIYRYLDDVKKAVRYVDTSETQFLDTSKSIVKQHGDLFSFSDIICSCPAMDEAIKLSKRVAKTDSSILIIGETGTGKELFAQSIHSFYGNEQRPFVAVNCAEIPENLMESTLFGTTKGSYTDALDKRGLFEEADGGTLFLDELHTLNIETQSKILRVLETKTVRKVGGNKRTSVNVRVLSSMNCNPLEAMDKGLLKPDLFYRIAVIGIRVPPLRERGLDEVRLLTNHFISLINAKLSTNISGCSEETYAIFGQYGFPGNCRELSHIIEHAGNMIEGNETIIQPRHLPYYINEILRCHCAQDALDSAKRQPSPVYKIGDYKAAHQKALDEFNTSFNEGFLKHALEHFNGNVTKTAKAIHISRQHLHGLITKYVDE
ncbi:AAA domain-containing protein [Pseudodesulfovibrio sp. JC047]|uniref:sigma-54 interaction domain-containing protein n=1 Tax=Pseudodesulfovibrio sp. JC047 TaxID=2683199 RepID=UPI0013D58B5E|nr:sigma 54-interacting transcriptional regulator [Pseudodesulfovibrio sp. JC047]NDV18792.1 AAA domain-containing protein [Pseudodesulfovibrio sp. JC047]